ncbi:hypothetical protein GQ600_5015 [Phytophthora cactorum]|nr:hypothetical protein GQ600_5015 [Phytophthora cactorum]
MKELGARLRSVSSLTTPFRRRVGRPTAKTTRHAVALDRQLRSSGHSAPDAVDARAEFSKLKLDYKYQSDYWQHRGNTVCRARNDVRLLLCESGQHTMDLRVQVATLTEQLQILVNVPDDWTNSCASDVSMWSVSLTFQWPRLRDLLSRFRDGTPVPACWTNVVSVSDETDSTVPMTGFMPMSRPYDG